jgi:hypothetical protein
MSERELQAEIEIAALQQEIEQRLHELAVVSSPEEVVDYVASILRRMRVEIEPE